MNEQDYQKVFDHLTDLSKRYALGKIEHPELYEGLKKLLGEVIAVEVQAARRRQRAVFWKNFIMGFLVVAVLGTLGFFLWRHGWIQPHLKGTHHKGK